MLEDLQLGEIICYGVTTSVHSWTAAFVKCEQTLYMWEGFTLNYQ